MSKNTGKSFEKLTQEIYQAFVDYDMSDYGFKKIQVQHNVKIKGKSDAEHQIDVFWNFKIAGIEYCTLVEAKDWKSPVKKEQVLSLKAKMDEIPNSNGIIVSQAGFQEGAKTYAEHHGIQLISITEDTDFKILLNSITTHYTDLKIFFDMEDLNKLPNGMEIFKSSLYESNYEDFIVIKPDKTTERLYNLMCENAKPFYYCKDNIRHNINEDLTGEWFLFSNKGSFPLTKIYGYSFDCYNTSDTSILTLEKLPILCMKDILNGTKMHYNMETKSVIKPCHIQINV